MHMCMACRGQTAFLRNVQNVRATRYKSPAIIEAEQNIFTHFHEDFAYRRFKSPDFVHILYMNTH